MPRRLCSDGCSAQLPSESLSNTLFGQVLQHVYGCIFHALFKMQFIVTFVLFRYHGIEVKDFGPSWRDGVAFQSVVHAIRPDLVDMEAVRRRSNRENLEEAFALAENELGIPRLLDPEGANDLFLLPSLNIPV